VLRYVHKDGSIIWCELHLVPIRNDADELVAVEGICRDVTQRKEGEDHLRAAYEREREAARRLRGLDAMKNSFLQAVSHELRTPLSAVYGMALTLQQSIDRLEPADRDELLARLEVNARKLQRLLADLLDLDRLMRHAIAPERKPTGLIELVRSVADEVDLGDRTLVIEGPEVVVAVDAPKVERIVENLLINVVRHTPEGVTVWVRALEHPTGATLVVEDDGPGIPDDLKDAIFEPFRQGPTAPRHAPGAGIGLSLAARFAELHGGRAWVEDRPGGGASFRVLLPGRLAPSGSDQVVARGA
jgi:signal transduction histidine kinase